MAPARHFPAKWNFFSDFLFICYLLLIYQLTPGLSCYWQIAPHRNDLSFEEWMDLDVKYVKERSFWVDWKIIFKTFKVCLLGRGE